METKAEFEDKDESLFNKGLEMLEKRCIVPEVNYVDN